MERATWIPRKSLVSVRLHRKIYTAPVDARAGTFSDLKALQSHFKAWTIKQRTALTLAA